MKLMDLTDIREIGRESVKKGMERTVRVLTALGFDVEAMRQEINQRGNIEVINV